MKKLLLIFILAMTTTFLHAQFEEYVYDFNDLSMGDLNGQDDWVTVINAAGNTDFDVNFGAGNATTPDGTLGIFYNQSAPAAGRTASRLSTPELPFDFSNGGLMEFEIQIHTAWWGNFFGYGYDADNNGYIVAGSESGTGFEEGEGGFGILICNHNAAKVAFLKPNAEQVHFDYDEMSGWNNFKFLLDLDANDGAGSISMSIKKPEGSWNPIPEVQELNLNLTPGSGDNMDPATWTKVFLHSTGGTGGYDNLIVRQPEDGYQFITFQPITDYITTNSGPHPLVAVTNYNLPVEFSVESGPATVDGDTFTLTGESGIVTIKASQPGNGTVLPAVDAFQSFEVIDPADFPADLTIRRPAAGTNVYMAELSEITLVASAYIEHNDVLDIENVEYLIGGESIDAERWFTGYNTGGWTPPDYGAYTMTVNVTSTNGVVSTKEVDFTVTSDVNDMTINTFDQVELNAGHTTDTSNFVFPTYVGSFDEIITNLNITCPSQGCEPWDRVGYMEVRGPTGEWVEIFRYITPYGVPCNHSLDVTDYSSLLQGLVEMRIHMGIWQNGLVADVDFDFQAGEPLYKYSSVNVIWRGTFPFGNFDNHQPMDTILWNYPPEAEASKLKILNSGHGWGDLNTGNAAEFYEATHHIKVDEDNSFDQHLWVQCNPNPDGCQPQNGTWYFDRAGWCPGSISYVYDYDLTDFVNNSETEIVYEFYPDYFDFCNSSNPDCVTGVTCSDCDDSFNPHFVISGNLITYSNEQIISDIEKDMGEIEGVSISPNPTSGVSTLLIPENNFVNNSIVSVLNMSGQLLEQFTVSSTTTEIDLSSYERGVYFVKIEKQNQSKILKVVRK